LDIHDQVQKVIRNMETRERKAQASRLMFEGSLLIEMSTRYNQYVTERQWDKAHECLLDISRLVVCMLSE
jgi:hypothetical protein